MNVRHAAALALVGCYFAFSVAVATAVTSSAPVKVLISCSGEDSLGRRVFSKRKSVLQYTLGWCRPRHAVSSVFTLFLKQLTKVEI
jgi:hypothetical protein